MKRLLMIAVFGAWATGAMAHSPLQATVPAHEAIVADMPSEIMMDFNGNIRLTRVSLTHDDAANVDVDLNGFSGFISDYVIPVESMGPGQYVIEWRGLGDDGHTLNGAFSFTVQ